MLLDRMWPDVYHSSHQGHKLARSGRGWRVAFPASSFCQTTLILTCRTFAALAQGLPGDQRLGSSASSPRSDRPDMVHQGPGLSVRLFSILSHQDSESRTKIPQEPFGFPVALQSRKKDVYRKITLFEMQCGLVRSLWGWKFGTFSSESGSITSSVALGT